jgi:hypothetical protein
MLPTTHSVASVLAGAKGGYVTVPHNAVLDLLILAPLLLLERYQAGTLLRRRRRSSFPLWLLPRCLVHLASPLLRYCDSLDYRKPMLMV